MPSSPVLTPPIVAKQLGVDPAKVSTWIKTGELRAINVATKTTGRPRWRIMPADLESFLASRTARPATPAIRRRKRQRPAGWVEYF